MKQNGRIFYMFTDILVLHLASVYEANRSRLGQERSEDTVCGLSVRIGLTEKF